MADRKSPRVGEAETEGNAPRSHGLVERAGHRAIDASPPAQGPHGLAVTVVRDADHRSIFDLSREIDRLEQSAAIDGMTLVITRVYVRKSKIKFEVGVAKGKKLYDKRETEMRRIVERETRAQLKERNR